MTCVRKGVDDLERQEKEDLETFNARKTEKVAKEPEPKIQWKVTTKKIGPQEYFKHFERTD